LILNGLTLGILTTVAFYALYMRFPDWAKRFFIKYRLLTDIVATILTYWLFAGTVTALFAAAWVCLLVEVLLYAGRHPEDFEFLADARDWTQDKIGVLREYLKQLNQTYRERKAATNPVANRATSRLSVAEGE